MENIPVSAGRTSFNLLKEDLFFAALDIQPGMTLLDLGCGVGNYAIAAAPRVGPGGIIHAFDVWEEGIEILETRASMANIGNISAGLADLGKELPLDDGIVDLCLLATFLHIMINENTVDTLVKEVLRVLKPEGTVAIVEFKKIEAPPGPPLSMRHSPAELEQILAPYKLRVQDIVDVGPYNYLALYGHD